jgi:hypothetical protein
MTYLHVSFVLRIAHQPRKVMSLPGVGVEVLKSSRKGAVDYSAVPELRGVNLEPYRKTPVAVVKINFIEPNQL